jgi:hypothetical protein
MAVEVRLARGQGLLDPLGSLLLDVAHFGESLGSEEIGGHVLGTLADALVTGRVTGLLRQHEVWPPYSHVCQI